MSAALEIVLPDRRRLALSGHITIGRAPGNTVTLVDPSVSRAHALISPGREAPLVEDAGSSYGTWLDDRLVEAPTALHEGSRIRVGNQELLVDRARGDDEAGATIVVTAGAMASQDDDHPRLHGGYRLKRLEAAEGERRWVLEAAGPRGLVRLSDDDAELLGLLDGTRTMAELVREAERRLGGGGRARLLRLLASLGDRGLLTDNGGPVGEASGGRRLLAQHRLPWAGARRLFARLYRHGGRLLVGPAARAPAAALALTGIAVFAGLVAARYGTPFVVAHKVGLGAAIFVLGRLVVAAAHETAHGLVMASFGRPVREAGVKLVLIFPYVYVDTTDAWFEPRRRRIAVSAAGPACDLCLGALFSLACLAAAPGNVRDVCFQLAFGAYVGAFFNLNPLVDRDGYQVLVDVLDEPRLRARARAQLQRQLAGGRASGDSPVLARYAVIALGWSAVGAVSAAALSLRYQPAFSRLAPDAVVWSGFAAVWSVLLLPVVVAIGPPLVERRRAR